MSLINVFLFCDVITFLKFLFPRDIKYQGDVRHKVKMGEANVNCDDGMSNLEVDWLDSPLNYTCYHSSSLLFPDESVETQLECEAELQRRFFEDFGGGPLKLDP